MQTDPSTTAPSNSVEDLALAELAFGIREARTTRHLAWAPSASIEFDLSDPDQRIFGDYELIEKIGEGGMGVVYRARQRSLDREVALKLLAAGIWAHPDFIERFRVEAQSAARMQHPHIVTIHEIGVHEEIAFYSMQLVRGPSLAQRLTIEGVLPIGEAVALLRTVAEAVHYAHQFGVLHLDLKPDNILIDERGSPSIADFGLARRLDQSVVETADEVRGTPSYMAPEQARGEQRELGVATDIYGLGAVLYEALTGCPPFVGRDAFDTLRQVCAGAPLPPQRLRAEVRGDLEAICLKCLAGNVADRYESARELSEDLGRFLEHRPVHAHPLPALARWWRFARREWQLAVAIAAAVLILAVGLLASTLEWKRAEASAATARNSLWHERIDSAWRLDESGNWFEALPLLLANLEEQEASHADPSAALERRRLGALFAASPRLIDEMSLGSPVEAVAISRDGARVAAGTADGRVVLFDSATGRSIGSVDTSSLHSWLNSKRNVLRGVFYLQFSADGRYVYGMPLWPGWPQAVPHPGGMNTFLIDATDGKAITPPGAFADFRDATFSPDGAYAVLRDTHYRAQAWRVRDWQPLGAAVPFAQTNPAWLAAAGGSRLAVSEDMRSVQLRDPASLAVRHVYPLPKGSGLQAWGFSTDGRLLALGDTKGAVHLLDADNGTPIHVFEPTGDGSIMWLSFSDDDRWLTAGSVKGDARVWQTGDFEAEGAALHDDEGMISQSADASSRVLLTIVGASTGHRVRLWQIPPDARLAPVAMSPWITHHGGGGAYGAAMAVNSRLLAVGSEDGNLALWRLPPGPLRSVRGAPVSVDELRFDGRHLVSVEGAIARVVDADTGNSLSPPLQHPGPVTFADLTADGQSMITISGHWLRTWDVPSGRPRFAPVDLAATPLRVAVSADGRRVAVSHLQSRPTGSQEVLGVWDVRSGLPVAPVKTFPGVLYGWHFMPGGSSLVIWQRDAAMVLDLASWQPMGPVFETPCRGQNADFRAFDGVMASADGRFLRAVCFDDPKQNVTGTRTVFTWDVARGHVVNSHSAGSESDVVAVSRDGTMAALGQDQALIMANGERRPLPATQGRAAAFDASGALLAIAFRDGVIIVDGHTGQAVTPTLRAALAMTDGIRAIAFSGDGTRVLAATRYGRWLVFDLPTEGRPGSDIRREMELLLGKADAGHALDEGARAALRRNDDPVPRVIASPSPVVASDHLQVPGLPRDPATPPALLDLSAAYNTNFVNFDYKRRMFERPDLPTMPLGVQRYLGVDYDVRGIITPNLRCGNGVDIDLVTPCAVDIPVSGQITTFHVLMTVLTETSSRQSEPLARLRLRYKDGQSMALDIRQFRDLHRNVYFHLYPQAPWKAPLLAWFPRAIGSDEMLGASYPVDEVRLANPCPDKELVGISVESTEVAWSVPLFYAITVERPDSTDPSRH